MKYRSFEDFLMQWHEKEIINGNEYIIEEYSDFIEYTPNDEIIRLADMWMKEEMDEKKRY